MIFEKNDFDAGNSQLHFVISFFTQQISRFLKYTVQNV